MSKLPEISSLNFYEEPPSGFETLPNLEDYSVKRFELYTVLIQQLAQDDLGNSIRNSTVFGNVLESFETQRIDTISHWLFRLAYSKSFETRQLFIKLETLWFQYRLSLFTVDQIVEITKKLLKLSPTISRADTDLFEEDCDYYRVKFTQVLDLVKKRLYRLEKGYLYIPDYELKSLLIDHFVKNLTKSTIYASKVLPTLGSLQFDVLLSTIPIIKNNQHFDNSDYYGVVDLANLDDYAVQFPMCMRYLHENLRKTHHLKYFGRMQYGLFIKAIGFNLDETLQLFHDEFIKTMPEDRFQRKYSYLFRHHYGTVGSKINQNAYSCEKIFEIDVNPGQVHGCPFKHWNKEQLMVQLRDYGLNGWQINEIVTMTKEGLFQKACGRYFEFVHNTELEEAIVHPNQYFFNCCKLEQESSDIEDLF